MYQLDLSCFDIVDLNEMLTYEHVNKKRAKKITEDLIKRNVLINPVIYDPKIKLLIDGHHRVYAFALLNYNHIATFNVDYFTNEVSVESWYRILSGLKMNQFKDILHFQLNFNYVSPSHNSFYLIIENSNGFMERIPFSDSYEVSCFLECLCDRVIKEGGKVILAPVKKNNQNVKSEFLLLSIHPIIGKTEVINAAISKKLYHFQVNRHLINNRPLGINLPLKVFDFLKADAIIEYRKHISQRKKILCGKARCHDGRFYEENTLLFQ